MNSEDKSFIAGVLMLVLSVGLLWPVCYLYAEKITGWMQLPYLVTVIAVYVLLIIGTAVCFNNAKGGTK